MCTSIYNTYKTNKFAPSKNIELSSIINDIKSGVYQDLVKGIQDANPEEQQSLKRNLPLFKTCIDANNQPNGLVHFDIDVKDNPSINFTKLKQDLIKIPEVIFCFISPRGGLKLALKTDFKSIDTYNRQRFKQAYLISKAHIQNQIESIVFDDSLASISQDCFVSHDADVYINLDVPLLKLNDDCVYVTPEYSRVATHNQISEPFIQEVLSYIPNDLKYDERLPINYAVLHELGEAGIYLLMAHWSTENRSKLESDLKSQLKNCKFGNIGTLIKKAREYGYTFKHEIRNSSYKFPALLTVEQADTQLKSAIHNFFDNDISTFLNVSTGFGKTTDTLDILRQLPYGKQVLILVQSHDFADELIEKYYEIKRKNIDGSLTPFEKSLKLNNSITGITHIKGKSHFADEQDYKNQFNSVANIRVLTHDEYVNEKSAYWYGTTKGDYSSPKKGKRKPDYIIIDENFIKRVPISSNLNTEYSSIRNIISNVLDGSTIEQAVKNNLDGVISDYQTAKAVKYPTLHEIHNELNGHNRINVIDDLKESRNDLIKEYIKNKNEIDILLALKMGDFNRLKVIPKIKQLHYFKMNKVHSRYKDVPTLYLDATANRAVINRLLPNVEYIDLQVKTSDAINVYQASDFNVSKKWLSKQENLDELVKMLKSKVSNNSNIGFITYKNIEGQTDFDIWLSEETGIKLYEHFGNLRGSDKFENVDELYVIGRQHLKPYEFNNLACAVFGDDCISDVQEWLDCPIRMKHGSSMSIHNKKYIDNRVELVKHHFSDSETLQALGRGRLIHGDPKDVYLLSNESLGADIEISGFISKKDMFDFTKFDDVVGKLKSIGYCRAMPKYLQKLGLSESESKKVHREVLHDELINAGIEVADVKFKDKNRIVREWQFYVSDVDKLKAHLDSIGATII